MTTTRYCDPWNAGLASETSAVCRRLGRLLQALHNEINSNIVQGAISDDLRNFSLQLQSKLENDGWSFSYDGGDRLKVRAPGHKKPFPQRMNSEAFLQKSDRVRYSDAFCETTSTTEAGRVDCAGRRGVVVRVFDGGKLCDVDWGDCFLQFATNTPSLVKES